MWIYQEVVWSNKATMKGNIIFTHGWVPKRGILIWLISLLLQLVFIFREY